MKSDLVVVSWWSNCLGLRCVQHLREGTEGRQIYVVQVGKSEAQKRRFRRHLPPDVTELPYPADRAAEHCRVLESVVDGLLPEHEGLWFVDHDVFFLDPLEPWLRARDGALWPAGCCLAYLTSPERRRAITSPLVWLSPRRLPAGLPGFEPLPFEPLAASRRPDLHRFPAAERMPEKDTLVRAQEFLDARGGVYRHPLESLPRHSHLGGLYLLAFERLPASLDGWMAGCVARFRSFFAQCPEAWLADEDPALLDRLETWPATLAPLAADRG
jgi:hypothetical protein